tara:strand:+ start:248 stop:850 length:603 start_codon:yes stop_codon:yes gene_type:complete
MIYIKIKKLLQPMIMKGEYLSKNNLYVEVFFNGITKKTRIINNNISPQWNEEFIFQYNQSLIDKIKKPKIIFTIWDEDAFGKKFICKEHILLFKTSIDQFRTQHLEIDYGLIYYEKDQEIEYKNKTIENRDNSIKHKNNIIDKQNKEIREYKKNISFYKNFYEEHQNKISQEQKVILIQNKLIKDLKSQIKKIKEFVNKI